MKNLMLTQMINIATDDEEDEEGPPLIILVKDGRNFRRAEVEDDPDEGEEEQSMGNSHGLSIRTNLDETLTAEAPTTPSSVVHAAVELLSDAVTRGVSSVYNFATGSSTKTKMPPATTSIPHDSDSSRRGQKERKRRDNGSDSVGSVRPKRTSAGKRKPAYTPN